MDWYLVLEKCKVLRVVVVRRVENNSKMLRDKEKARWLVDEAASRVNVGCKRFSCAGKAESRSSLGTTVTMPEAQIAEQRGVRRAVSLMDCYPTQKVIDRFIALAVAGPSLAIRRVQRRFLELVEAVGDL
jgi:hypothetical protein